MPPLPSHSPASRYSGIGDSANRRASAPSNASAVRIAPSCKSSGAEICTQSALLDQLLHAVDAGFGADNDQYVGSAQLLGWPRRSEHLVIAHDRDDRRAGSGSGTGVPQRPVHEDAAGQDVPLTGFEPRYFASELNEPFGDPGRTQNLGDRIRFLVGETKDRASLVGVVAAVQDDLEVAATSRDDADLLTVVAGELVPHPHAGQQHLFDVHGASAAWPWRADPADGPPRGVHGDCPRTRLLPSRRRCPAPAPSRPRRARCRSARVPHCQFPWRATQVQVHELWRGLERQWPAAARWPRRRWRTPPGPPARRPDRPAAPAPPRPRR